MFKVLYSWNFKAVILTLILIGSGTAYGAGINLLDDYLRVGLENNLVLKQKRENSGVRQSKIRRNNNGAYAYGSGGKAESGNQQVWFLHQPCWIQEGSSALQILAIHFKWSVISCFHSA